MNVQTELYLACMVIIGRIVTYKIFINKQLKHTNVTIRLALYIYINITVQSKLGSSRAMLASDIWIEKLAILSHEDAIYSVDPLSSEDVAVVVDFHWFTDCHLEAIFNMNTSRLQLRFTITVDGKDVREFVWSPASPWIRLNTTFFRSSINLYQTTMSRHQSFFVLIGQIAFSWYLLW